MEGQPTLLDHLYNEGRLRTISHLSDVALGGEWGPEKHRSYDENGQKKSDQADEFDDTRDPDNN